MKKTRMANRKILKWVASGVMLALLFAIVFAGTLSGAFGIENSLQNSGVIENNVADADWTHQAGITIGDSNSGGTNVTAMSAITEVGTYNYYGTTTLTDKYGVYMSDGSSGDIKRTTSTVGIYQGITGSTRNGMVYIVVPLSSEVQSVVDQERVTVSFSGLFGGGNPDYSTYKLFVYSSSKEVVAGSSYSQSDFKDSILNTTTNSTSSSSGTLATGNAGYCNATGIPDTDQDGSDSDYSARTISANVIKGAKSLVLGIMVRGGGYHGLARRKMMVFMRNASVTLACSSAKISVSSDGNGSVSKVTSSDVTISGSDYTFTKILSSLEIKATPNSGYHFNKWQKTSSSVISDYNTDVTSSLASSTATFYGYKIWNNESYTALFAANQVTVVYHKNLDSDTSTTTQTVSYSGSTTTLRSESATGKSFLGWSTSANSRVLYHSASNLTVAATNIGLDSDGNVVDLTNATHHGKTVHLYAVWSERDFGITSGKDYDSTWGSQDNPFVIENARHLVTLSEIVNGTLKKEDTNSVTGGTFNGQTVTTNAVDITFAGCYFVLGANIDMSGVAFVPIGMSDGAFKATKFDFSGYDIENLSITESGSNVGLFGWITSATTITNSSNSAVIVSGSMKGVGTVGGLIGINYGTVSGEFEVNTTVESTSGEFTGGVIGRNHGTVSDATFTHTGEVTGYVSTGGIMGFSGTKLDNAQNNGKVNGTTAVGGIAGRAQNQITNCTNEATVSSSTANSHSSEVNGVGTAVGGIVGYSNNKISACTNKGAVTAASSSAVGGIVGIGGYCNNTTKVWTSINIVDCTNSNKITGKQYVGGLVGYGKCNISGSNSGDVVGVNDVGGICGFIEGNSSTYYEISATSNTGNITASENCVGGIIGEGQYAKLLTSARNEGNITGKQYVGGLVGNAKGSSGGNNIIVHNGYNKGTISSNYTSGTPIDGYIGGLIGKGQDTHYYNTATNDGVVNAPNVNCVGGIVGFNNGGRQQDSTLMKNNATVTGHNYVGGITGTMNWGYLSNVENDKAVTGNDYVAGIVGYFNTNGQITGSVTNSGVVSGVNYVGGIAGKYLSGTLGGSVTNSGTVTVSKNVSNSSDRDYDIISGKAKTTGGTETLASIKDDDDKTKYCNASSNKASFVVDLKSAVVLRGFAITNANDNDTQWHRTAKIVKIWGTDTEQSGSIETDKDGTSAPSGWDLIYSNTNLGKADTIYERTSYSFSNFRAYRYYWVYVESKGGKDSNGNELKGLQFSEFDFIADNAGAAQFTGGIAGWIEGTSIGSGSTFETSAKVSSTGYYVGGIFGYITDMTADATFETSASGGDSVTGLVGVGGAFGYVDSSAHIFGTIYITCEEVDKENGSENYIFGGVAGYNAGEIDAEITVSSRVMSRGYGTVNGVQGSFVGGVVGYNAGTLKGSVTKSGGDVLSVSEKDYVGGIVGYNSGTMEGTFTHSATYVTYKNATILGANYVGGIVGYTTDISFDGASNAGAIVSFGTQAVGGIVGGMASGASVTLEDCSNTGKITAESANGVAGIIGHSAAAENTIHVTGCSNTGDIKGQVNTGGIGGRMETKKTVAGTLTFTNCYNSGNISTSTSNTVGGIVGYMYANPTASTDDNTYGIATLTYSYSSGTVTSATNSNYGAIIGNPRGAVAADTQSTRVVVSYCYTTTNLQISGTKHGYVDNTNYVITSSVPSITNGGSYLLHDSGMSVTPAVVNASSCTDYTWTDITSQDINGFKVVGKIDPTVGQYFKSTDNANNYFEPNAVANSDSKAGDRDTTAKQNVSVWYSANKDVNNKNIVCTIAKIEIDDVDDGSNDGFNKDAVKNLPADHKYTVSYPYYHGTEHGYTELGNADTYNVTVLITINGIVVGKKTYAQYTIIKIGLKIEKSYDDSYTYNSQQQGLKSFEIKRVDGVSLSLEDLIKNSETIPFSIDVEALTTSGETNFVYTLENNTYTLNSGSINAGKYTVTVTLTADNYYLVNDNDEEVSYLQYKWTINPYSLKSSNVYFGANDNMLLGNTSKIFSHGNLNVWELNNALVYTKSEELFKSANIVVYVQFGDDIIKLTVDSDYTLSGWNGNPGNLTTVTLTVNGDGNYTGTLTKTFLAMDSDFGGLYGSNGWGGSGNKFKIEHAAHLIRLSEIVNGTTPAWNSIRTTTTSICATNNTNVLSTITSRTYQNAYFEVTGNINVGEFLGKSKSFTPIGINTDNSFKGNFDGNSKSITNLMISTSGVAGLFGVIDGATISDITIGASGEKASISGGSQVGGLVGYAKHGSVLAGTIICYTDVTGTSSMVGGIVGQNHATLRYIDNGQTKNTTFIHAGDVSGGNSVGGLFGFADGDSGNPRSIIDDATNSGSVTGTTAVGGLVGRSQTIIQNSTNSATVTSKTSNKHSGKGGEVNDIGAAVGGITGYSNSAILNCKNTGAVNGTNTETKTNASGVGGIVGIAGFYSGGKWIGIEIDGCENNGSVTGKDYVGGIAGYWQITSADQYGTVKNVIENSNAITVTGNTYVGGIVGWLEASSCPNALTVTPDSTLNNNKITVTGKNCVGYLFGAFLGNGYHETANASIGTELMIANTFNGTVKGISGGAVLGGLVGFMSKSAMIFSTNWNTINITFDDITFVDLKGMSFVGGLIGMLGENGTIESVVQLNSSGGVLSSAIQTITADRQLGEATIETIDDKSVVTVTSKLGSFVGGIVGYVTSSAGAYYGDGTTILGNTVKLISNASIYADGYVGGIFGAVGDFDHSTADSIADACGKDIKSYLVNLLETGNFAANKGATTLAINPNGSDKWHGNGGGQLVNNGGGYIWADNDYAGGIIGYVGTYATITFENDKNTMLDKNDAINSNMSVYVDRKYVHVRAAGYAGGLIGYLSNGAHSLKYIVSGAYMGSNTEAEYVGGVVGYMGSGTIEGCVSIYPDEKLWYYSSTYKGTQNVGGIVGYTINGVITNCVSAGFNLEETTSTKGGILGGGVNPTITSSWAFYIARDGSTYTRVSNNSYGKYIAVDDGVDVQLTIKNIVDIVKGDSITFKVIVPPGEESNSGLKNKQLAFYNGTGSDTVTGNAVSSGTSKFTEFSQQNGTLIIGLDKATAESMQVYVVDIEFVDVPQGVTGETEKVQKTYRHPSSSENYEADVLTAEFSNKYINKISANIYFNPTGTGQTLVGSLTADNRGTNNSNYIGNYNKENLDPPLTISSLKEWNNFAQSVQDETNNNYSGKVVKLLNDIPLKDDDGKVLSTEPTTVTLAGKLGSGFMGTFDGNGHTIDIGTITASANGTSLFPYANGATFKNLTIKGNITLDNTVLDSATACNGVAGFVGIAEGKLTFHNCTNQVNITTKGYNVGGILGQSIQPTATGTTYEFIDCVNEGKIQNWYKEYKTGGVGGIIGNILTSNGASLEYGTTSTTSDTGTAEYITVTLESCRNAGIIEGTFNVGGIIGRNGGNTTITNCGNSGNITAYGITWTYENGEFKNAAQSNGQDTSAGGIGGLVTEKASINVYASYNSGDVISWGNKAGGILASDAEYESSGNVSCIYYCYNTGDVYVGGNDADDDENKNKQISFVYGSTASYGANGGGILGTAVYADVQYCYNTGQVTCNGAACVGSGTRSRIGGIVGYLDAQSKEKKNVIKYCYNVGLIYIASVTTVSWPGADGVPGGAGPIIGADSDSGDRLTEGSNYSLLKSVKCRYNDSATIVYNRMSQKDEGNYYDWREGTPLESIDLMTAYMNSSGNLEMSGFGISQNITALSDITVANGGYIYVYGCLPQLAVFAVDTQNGLAMTSKAYGQDQYGTFTLQQAGSVNNPFIIKDGIDLLGIQSLVTKGYDFSGKYIEFANSTNNLNKVETKQIVFPSSSKESEKYSGNGYKSYNGSTYTEGSSYHLFKLSAVCSGGVESPSNSTPYASWLSRNYYYSVADGKYLAGGYFDRQNFIAIGRTINNLFAGNISGEQSDGARTKLVGAVIPGSFAGVFSTVLNANISYIELNNSTVSGNSTSGGIVGRAYGTTVVDNCAISGTTAVSTNGSNYYVGGIVGVAKTATSKTDSTHVNEFEQGVVLSISNCVVNDSVKITGTSARVGGILGSMDSAAASKGMNNIVRIQGCSVTGATISTTSTGSYIGGVLGYGSTYVISAIENCSVGGSETTVTISGKTNIGGIVGAMSSVPGGYIENCSVGAKATIKATAEGASSIGGLVGSSDAATTDDGITMDFARENSFAGVIDLDGKKASNVGGIIGSMNNGASFNENSVVSVTGSIIHVSVPTGTITEDSYSTNFGGIAGSTSKAAFSGQFTVSPQMDTGKVDNVGGFIGKNEGKTDIVAVGTTITIGGEIKGLKEVGGFIGINDTGATLTIGDDMYSGVPRTGAVTITIRAAISSEGDNAGGIVGKNDNGATINIVKGTISTIGDTIVDGQKVNGSSVSGANNVGGIVGLNDGNLTTGGSEYSDAVLSITNGGSVEGTNYVGGVFGKLNAGTITGEFTNSGSVEAKEYFAGGVIGYLASGAKVGSNDNETAILLTNSGEVKASSYAGGSIGYVAQGASIIANSHTDATVQLVNSGSVSVTNYFAGGSIGILYGSIDGVETNKVVFKVQGSAAIDGISYLGGSIGVIAGKIDYATFTNSANLTVHNGQTAIGGSVGFVGLPNAGYIDSNYLNINAVDDNYGIVSAVTSNFINYILIQNTHFEATGSLTIELTATASATESTEESTTDSGGVGGAIGVIGGSANKFTNSQWKNNTYYAMADVKAPSVNNVGGVFGLIRANGFEVSNMLAYQTTVQGNKNVGGIVGAVDATGVKISQCFALEGEFSGEANVGGIVGLAKTGLAEGNTDASSSYWMLGLENGTLANSDITELSTKLGFTLNEDGTFKEFSLLTDDDDPHIYTTGDNSHGWFFIYANNANGNGGIGTINVTHKVGLTNGVPNSLAYWKFIAQAYSSGETVPESMTGSALTSNSTGSISAGYVYATATAAEVVKSGSGYYLYSATYYPVDNESGVKPTMTYSDKFYISINTENKVGNFAVYYRVITSAKDELAYNGYARTAAVGMDDVGLIDNTNNAHENYPTLTSSDTNVNYANNYYYTTATLVAKKDADGNVIEGEYDNISGNMIDPGVYKSTFYIYYFDSQGVPHIVGGIENHEWKITARTLTGDWGEIDKGAIYGYNDGKDHMSFTIENIAPGDGEVDVNGLTGYGLTHNIIVTITSKDGNTEYAKFEWNYLQNNDKDVKDSSSGITLKGSGDVSTAMAGDDLLYIAGTTANQELSLSTYKYSFTLKFTFARNYKVVITTTEHYSFRNEKNFDVDKRPLTITTSFTSGQPYTYNVDHQGAKEISINNGSTSTITGLMENDKVVILATIKKDGNEVACISVTVGYDKTVDLTGILTRDAGKYTITYSLPEGSEANDNYSIPNNTVEWEIKKKEIKLEGISFSDGGSKVYDGIAFTPTVNVTTDLEGSNQEFEYNTDKITVSVKLSSDSSTSAKIVNAGTYTFSTGSGSVKAEHSNGSDASSNYEIIGTQSAQYTIKPREITVKWNTSPNSWVYDGSTHYLTISGITPAGTGSKVYGTPTSTQTQIKTGYGNDIITFKYSGGKENVGTTKMSLDKKSGEYDYTVDGTNDNIASKKGNYKIVGGNESGNFTITASKLKISSAYATGVSKVYDGNTTVNNGTISWNITRADGNTTGAVPVNSESTNSWSYFKVTSKAYTSSNVGSGIKIRVEISYISNNENYAGSSYTAEIDSGTITPAEFTVTLDKLRNGKATRTYISGNAYYGGSSGASNGTTSGRSSTYRSGEGFTISGFVSGEKAGAVTVKAVYQEVDRDRKGYDSYVNGIQLVDGVYNTDGKFYKDLVFTKSGDSAGNYTFKIVDASGNVYCSTTSSASASEQITAAATNSLTVYDSAAKDKNTKYSNADSASAITIEITPLTYTATYTNTVQSYVDANNKYNENWQAVEVSGVPSDIKVVVSNGWMTDGNGNTKKYTGYTVIRGSSTSATLGAHIEGTSGSELNYKLVNQPILTIGYFVQDNGDVFEIGSTSGLLIASYYWWVASNNINPDFNAEITVKTEWITVATNEQYTSGEGAPNGKTWDEYFETVENDKQVSIFYNDDKSSWGYYSTEEISDVKKYTQFKQIKDINGVLTSVDIEILNNFFVVDNNGTLTSTWGSGTNYLDNVITKTSGQVLTVLGSLFKSYADKDGNVNGFGGTFDGNGYVIEYLNIMGYGYDNVGLFDVINDGTVKNLHLRNISINVNKGNVGGIAGQINAGESAVSNVSFHGSINVSGSEEMNVGGLFGKSERDIDKAIVLGTINSSNASAVVGGVVGDSSDSSASISNVVSMMQITANGTKTGAFVGDGTPTMSDSYHMKNAVYNGTVFVNDSGKDAEGKDVAVTYTDLMGGSKTGYGNTNKYYYNSSESVGAGYKGIYDVLDDYAYVNKASENDPDNAKQSMRLYDIVSVYLLMYSLDEGNTTVDNSIKVYTISDSSWLVGNKHGTNATDDAIVIANKQNVSLLRELRFATFTLGANIDIEIASTFSGTFYGTVNMNGKIISCNKEMFDVYCNDGSVIKTVDWLNNTSAQK